MAKIANTLFLYDDYIQLDGFSQVQGKAVFYLYSDGVAITSFVPEKVNDYHYIVDVDVSRRIHSLQLINALKNKRCHPCERFICVEDCYLQSHITNNSCISLI